MHPIFKIVVSYGIECEHLKPFSPGLSSQFRCKGNCAKPEVMPVSRIRTQAQEFIDPDLAHGKRLSLDQLWSGQRP